MLSGIRRGVAIINMDPERLLKRPCIELFFLIGK